MIDLRTQLYDKEKLPYEVVKNLGDLLDKKSKAYIAIEAFMCVPFALIFEKADIESRYTSFPLIVIQFNRLCDIRNLMWLLRTNFFK